MASSPETRSQNRKKHYSDEDLSQEDLSLPPLKRLKSSIELPPASKSPPPSFWDSLSKVWLTRRALRELDQRNQFKSSICVRAPAQKPERQFSNQKDLQLLQRLARLGGPELRDLRGYPKPADVNVVHTMGPRGSDNSNRFSQSKQSISSESTSNSTSETSNTESSRGSSSAYDTNFEQHLVDHGIYPEGYEYPDDRETPKPSNLKEIRQRLARPRSSLSSSRFSNSAFRDFKRANNRVNKEGDVMRTVLPTLCGNNDILSQEDVLFTTLKSITKGATVDAKPNFYDGARFESVDRQVRKELGSFIIPTKDASDVMKRQITYDLSLGARGMLKLQSYGVDEPVFNNKAYTLGATYHDGSLIMYATHITPSGPGGSPEYHMTQIDGWATTGRPDSYRRGAAALRHAKEPAMEWRDEFISAANERTMNVNAQL